MPLAPRRFRPFTKKPRPSDKERNQQPHRKLLWTKRYRKFRLSILTERPLCEEADCRELGKDIHHKRGLADYPEDLCDPENVQVLCHSHHSIRTRRGE